MDGKRFGAGIAGGLLLGLLIVATSGVSTGIYGTFSASPAQNAVTSTQSTGSSTVVASSSSLTVMSSTQPSGSANGTYYTANKTTSESVSSTSSSSSSASSPQGILADLAAGPAGRSPSNLDSLTNQPAVVSGIVLLPVLMAVMLGAILYRSSRGPRREADEVPE